MPGQNTITRSVIEVNECKYLIASVYLQWLFVGSRAGRCINMTSMETEQRRKWLIRGTVLVLVFAGALSMHMERLRGWSFLVLCFIAGSIGGLGFVWARQQLKVGGNRLSKQWKAALIGAAIALVLVVTLILNYGRPDAAANTFLTVGGVVLALIMWSVYRLFSRLIDALRARFTNR